MDYLEGRIDIIVLSIASIGLFVISISLKALSRYFGVNELDLALSCMFLSLTGLGLLNWSLTPDLCIRQHQRAPARGYP
jgi:hypothetical protein